jgi:hypothetical protein
MALVELDLGKWMLKRASAVARQNSSRSSSRTHKNFRHQIITLGRCMEIAFLILSAVIGLLIGGMFSRFVSNKKIAVLNEQISAQNTRLTKSEAKCVEMNASLLMADTLNKEISHELTESAIKFSRMEGGHSQVILQLSELKQEFLKSIEQIQELRRELEIYKLKNTELSTKFSVSDERLKDAMSDSGQKLRERESEIQRLGEVNRALTKEMTILKEQEPALVADYSRKAEILNMSMLNHQADRAREREASEQVAVIKLQRQKETWERHEKEVEELMKSICQAEGVEYVAKGDFPGKGSPDNSVKICDEFIIFDSKSPQGEDLSHFPTYIRTQAENAKKYAKQDVVRNEVFFVVPINAISEIAETTISLGEYVVHVITADSLRPILIQLKKIEAYEFIEQMSPEDRGQISTYIGKCAHFIKRNIQLHQFIDKVGIGLVLDGEKLPESILEAARDVERSSKLNPPIEQRKKSIDIAELEKENANIIGTMVGQTIHFGEELDAIESLPLHSVVSKK